ncbi:uncharacterized protein LOC142786852 [Rhipicephalus microplus]|uniref:uncharacterized protein LOC142786852 n=1 Tax=Rhipicephalus microplus TaxID=6941 RepID=UPI003F6AA6BF
MTDPGPSHAATPNLAPVPVFCAGALRQRDPPIFGGTEDQNVDNWIAEYELVSAVNKWNAADKLTNMSFYLTDVAKLWYRNHQSDFSTWSELAKTLAEVFGRPAVRRLRAEQRLRGRVQRADETFTSYIEDVLFLCNIVDSTLDEAGKIKNIMKGIDDGAFQMLAAKSPQTVAKVIQLCQSYDELRRQRASTCCAAQDTADISSLDYRHDTADHSALMPVIKQFIREEVAGQLSIITRTTEPMAPLSPSLRQVIRSQVAEALPPAQAPPTVTAPLTYAAAVAQPRAPASPAIYEATRHIYSSTPPSRSLTVPSPAVYETGQNVYMTPPPARPFTVPYSANSAPIVSQWRTPDVFFMWHPRPRSSSLPSSQLPFSRHCRGLTLLHAHHAAISRSCQSTSRRTSRSPTIRRKPFTFSSSSIYFSDVTSQQPTARGKLTSAVPEARTALAAKISRRNCCPPNEIELYIDGIKVHGLVDTGAAVSVISEKLCRNLRKVTTQLTDLSLQTATSHHIQPSALCTARVVIQGAMYVVTFVVLFRSSHDVILGWDFLSSNSALVDCARSELALSVPCYDPDDGASCRVFAASDVDIAPFSAVVVSVSCASPPKSPVLFMPSVPSACRRNIMLPFAVVIFRNGHAAIYVCNPSHSP